MEVYVTYLLCDYTHAIGLSTDIEVAEKYAAEMHEITKRPTWVDVVKVGKELTELDCD